MTVIGQAEDGRIAVDLARELTPDIVVMDIGMPDLNGIEATREIRRQAPTVKVIGLSMYSAKRYVTEIDLTSRTTTGDPEGDLVERREAPDQASLERALERLRGEVELPIPAASAVKIEGERAYRLHRRGVAVEMPTRVMRVHSLELVSYGDGVATLDLLVGSGTYVRSIADVLGGHCATLRRTHVGPFSVGVRYDPLAQYNANRALENTFPGGLKNSIRNSIGSTIPQLLIPPP